MLLLVLDVEQAKMTDYRTKNRPLSNNVSAHCFRYIFNVNDQNIGPLSPSLPLSLISLSPYLLLSLSLPLSHSHSLTLSLSPFLLLPLSLRPSLPLSLSLYLPLLLYFSHSLRLYTSLPSPSLELEQATPVATEPAILPR